MQLASSGSIVASFALITRAMAKERGLSLYFTGKACKRGHVAPPRRTVNGACAWCSKADAKAWRSTDEYKAAQRARWKATAKENWIKWRRDYEARQRQTEKWKAGQRRRARQHYLENKEAYVARAKRWKKANPDVVKACHLDYDQRKPEVRYAVALRRRARKLQSEDRIRYSEIKALRVWQGNLCSYCWKPASTGNRVPELDHVEPIALGGAHSADNLVVCCRSCNAAKSDKPLLIFLMQRFGPCS